VTRGLALLLPVVAALGLVAGCGDRAPSVGLACWATQRWIDATPAERDQLWETVVRPAVERLPAGIPVAQKVRDAVAEGPAGAARLADKLQPYCD